MPIKVEHPVLGTVEFPDDYSMEQIDRELLEIGSDILPEDSARKSAPFRRRLLAFDLRVRVSVS